MEVVLDFDQIKLIKQVASPGLFIVQPVGEQVWVSDVVASRIMGMPMITAFDRTVLDELVDLGLVELWSDRPDPYYVPSTALEEGRVDIVLNSTEW